MEVLVGESDEFDPALLARQRIAQDVGLGCPDGRIPLQLPEPVQGAKPRRPEHGDRLSETVIGRLRRPFLAPTTFPEEPFEFLRRRRRNRRRQLLPRGVAELPDGPRERLRDEDADGPSQQRPEQLAMVEEKQPKVHRHRARDQVEEDMVVRPVSLNADRQLVREIADGAPCIGAERQARKLTQFDAALELPHEVAPLVGLCAEPHERPFLDLLAAPIRPSVGVAIALISFLEEALVVAFQLAVELHPENAGVLLPEAFCPDGYREGSLVRMARGTGACAARRDG